MTSDSKREELAIEDNQVETETSTDVESFHEVDHTIDFDCLAITSRYRIASILGVGAFGEVFLAHPAKGRPVAIKRIHSKDPMKRLRATQEAEAHRSMKHRNIPKVFAVHQDERFTYIIMEYVDGSDLFQVLADREYVPFREVEIREFLFRIARAVYYCHRKNIAHGDIKLENIMVASDRTPKLIDFGLCQRLKSKDLCFRYSGTSDYACPQIIWNVPYSESKADVWALGVVFFTVITGQIPFCRDQREQMSTKGQHPTIIWRNGCNVSREFRNLIDGMLAIDQKDRFSMSTVVGHQWFTPARRAEFNILRNSVRGSINVL